MPKIKTLHSSLRPYCIFSRSDGRGDGAILVFAHTVREAKKIGWQAIGGDFISKYIDMAVQLFWNTDKDTEYHWLFAEADSSKLLADEAHVIESPRYCKICEFWGHAPINVELICKDCELAMKKEG